MFKQILINLNEYFFTLKHNKYMMYSELGTYIRSERLSRNVSLNEFAFTNDIDPAILSRIENLKQGIKLDILLKIAHGFNKTPAEFLADFETNCSSKK